MLALTVVVCGIFSLLQINIDLLPKISYPDIRVVVQNKGVPAAIMEDEITRQLEEQLAITQGVIHIESSSKLGRSRVALSFKYGQDIDIALRDASARLDRAKRFLPQGIAPPIIYKRDPSQIPVAEYIVSSKTRSLLNLRDWTEYQLSKWLINIEGIAATEVGGGVNREINIEVDADKIAQLGLTIQDIATLIKQNNQQTAAGRLTLQNTEINLQTAGRFKNLAELAQLPFKVNGKLMVLADIASIKKGHNEERLKIRLNQQTGIKLSIQKQPEANTIEVVKALEARLKTLQETKLIPAEIQVTTVANQAQYIQHSLNNTLLATLSGALLAMFVVWLFLADIRRALIIGSAIPLALLATFIPMAALDMTLNLMTFGGLALGIGLLVDNTIVMLENIVRHQQLGQSVEKAAEEVRMPIIASTSTNLAAILPFLFISGLIGLLFKELIFTISFAIVSSLLVAFTLVPALAKQLKIPPLRKKRRFMLFLQTLYGALLTRFLNFGWLLIIIFIMGLSLSLYQLMNKRQIFLPKFDEGQIYLSISGESGTNIKKMDQMTQKVEQQLQQEPAVAHFFTTVGGFIFGRSTFESSNRSSIKIQLKSLVQRDNITTKQWIKTFKKKIKAPEGIKIRLRQSGLRGIRINRGNDDLVLRIQGGDFQSLEKTVLTLESALKKVKGLSNIEYSNEEKQVELAIIINREKAALYGLTAQQIGETVRYAIDGLVVGDFIEQDRAIELRLRYNRNKIKNPQDLHSIKIKTEQYLVRLDQVASIQHLSSPAIIYRDNQQRMVEVSASLADSQDIESIMQTLTPIIQKISQQSGYRIYETGALTTLQENRALTLKLIILAVFLVFVVMAVQYESLRNPFIIMLGVPFTLIGVDWGLSLSNLPLSMPVWLGIIMLIGIVVNNAIILVEQIEICRQTIENKKQAIIQASQQRLRPILMTSLTTIIGMIPLALSLNEGAEMLQPLAIVIIAGLSFALLVSLLLMPILYYYLSSKIKCA